MDGQVFAMAGASKNHNEIALNLALALRQLSKCSSCRVFMSDMKLRISQRNSYIKKTVSTLSIGLAW